MSTVSNDTSDRDPLETQMLHSIGAHDLMFDEACRILKTLTIKRKAETLIAPIYTLFEKICALWWVGKEETTIVSKNIVGLKHYSNRSCPPVSVTFLFNHALCSMLCGDPRTFPR